MNENEVLKELESLYQLVYRLRMRTRVIELPDEHVNELLSLIDQLEGKILRYGVKINKEIEDRLNSENTRLNVIK